MGRAGEDAYRKKQISLVNGHREVAGLMKIAIVAPSPVPTP